MTAALSPPVVAEGAGLCVPALELSGIHFGFGTDADVLAGIDLSVPTGSLAALLGPSGCGKTTLLRVVAGFVRPERGTVSLAGRTVAGPGVFVAPERRRVGIVPQEGTLFPHMDVGRNVGFGLVGMARGARARRVAECLELVGLAGSEKRRPAELSGGQQQRVALARALAPEPSVVLLDEPFSALDATLRAQVRDDVRAVLHTAGATALLVTHDQEEALSFADTVAVMRDGRLAQVADPVTLYRHPADLGVARFVGESVVLAGELHADGVRCALGDLAVEGGVAEPASGPVDVVIRPEQLDLVEPDGAGMGVADFAVVGVVGNASYFGHDTLVPVLLESGEQVVARLNHHRLPAAGVRVGVRVRGAVSVFADSAG